MKFSVDFDQTLDNPFVQGYIAGLINLGHEGWIVTSRYFEGMGKGIRFENKDLYAVAKKIGIPKERIIFCDMTPKWEHMIGEGFIWHLDDDDVELQGIATNTSIAAIDVKSKRWLGHCERFIERYK